MKPAQSVWSCLCVYYQCWSFGVGLTIHSLFLREDYFSNTVHFICLFIFICIFISYIYSLVKLRPLELFPIHGRMSVVQTCSAKFRHPCWQDVIGIASLTFLGGWIHSKLPVLLPLRVRGTLSSTITSQV